MIGDIWPQQGYFEGFDPTMPSITVDQYCVIKIEPKTHFGLLTFAIDTSCQSSIADYFIYPNEIDSSSNYKKLYDDTRNCRFYFGTYFVYYSNETSNSI